MGIMAGESEGSCSSKCEADGADEAGEGGEENVHGGLCVGQ